MLNSKALKESPKKFMKSLCGCPEECDIECGYIGMVFHPIMRFMMFKLYYPVIDSFHRYKERIGRSLAYARFGWLNYDFDMACAWDLFEFKLRRLNKCLETGHAIQEQEDMNALQELIEIVKRQGDGTYEEYFLDEHDKKWGEIETRIEPASYDKKGEVLTYSWHSWRKNSPENGPVKLKKQERKEYRACYTEGEKLRVKDIKRMGEILIKFGLVWWD